MIYTVELNYSDPTTADNWSVWYETYLRQLVFLDGLDTAQRFRAQSPDTQFWEYLAIYTVPNLDVYETKAYRAIDGGGNASKTFHHATSRRRDVYDGVARMPEVTNNTCVLFCEDVADGIDLPGVLFVPLRAGAGNQQADATKIDGKPEQRSIALTDAATADRIGAASIEGLAVYAPITRYYS
jgi:hypothetical protein